MFFFSEVIRITKENFKKTLISFLALTLIMVFSLVASSVYIGATAFSKTLADQSEIAVFYKEGLVGARFAKYKSIISGIPGVLNITEVSADEAASEMIAMLGPEAKLIAEYEGSSPFDPYLKVTVSTDFDSWDSISKLKSTEYLRDSRNLIKNIGSIVRNAKIVGLIIIAITIASFVLMVYYISSEIIRSNSGYISNLKIMGAPDRFIYTPFLLQTFLVVFISSGIGAITYRWILSQQHVVIRYALAGENKLVLIYLALAFSISTATSFITAFER